MIGSIIGLMAAAMASSSDPAPTPPSADSLPASSTPAVKPKPKKDPLDKIVCHEDAETGSHLSSAPICKTQRQWNEITAASHKLLEDTTRGGMGYKAPGG